MNEKKRTQAAIAATIGENGTLSLVFANGKAITVNPDELATNIRAYAVLHGLKQKLVDAAAIARNPDNGRSATIDDKYNAVKAVYDRLMAGQWNAPREGGGGSGGLLFRALMRMYPEKGAERLTNYLATLTDAEKTALRGNPSVAANIAAIREETGKAANIDTDALLSELDDVAGA